MTIKEAAAHLNVGTNTVYRMCAAGELSASRVLFGRRPVLCVRGKTLSGPRGLLAVKQAAKRLGLHPQAVYKLCASGKLPHRRIGAGRGVIRIKPVDVDEYLRQRREA